MKVGGRLGDTMIWVERTDEGWIVHGHGGSRATARTADLAARLYTTEVAHAEERQ